MRRYLREFLHDPRVVDLSPIARTLLVEGLILPTRPRKSAEAYAKIWTAAGSPLLVESLALLAKVRAHLGPKIAVELAMRYGKPSIPVALEKLRAAGVTHLVIAPLYPQYASSSTGSSVEAVLAWLARQDAMVPISVLPAFYDDPGFIDAFAQVGRPVLDRARPDHVLFSFHGLPERQVRKSDHSGRHCLESDRCCERIVDANRDCYRAQCFATARALARKLELAAESEGRWTVTFQSRLGRTPWIHPYTDVVIPALAAQGKKRLAVFCPAFVADCLETLEEIALRARDQFVSNGGEELVLVPSLNASDAWVAALCDLLVRCMPSDG